MKNAPLVRIYTTTREARPFLAVYRDPLQRSPSGRAKRVVRWFVTREAAEAYQREKTAEILTVGTAGINFDAVLRTDAIAAKRLLAEAGHETTSLLELARDYVGKVTVPNSAGEAIGPAVLAFLDEKEHVEGAAEATVTNLRNRILAWVNRERISSIGEISRARIESIRTRPGVSPNSRRNDFAAISSLCTWLLEKGKISHHPVKGLRRPKVPIGPKHIYTTDECERLLDAAQAYLAGRWLASIATMLFVGGARPSEIAQTRIFYGRHPTARIEGGKLRGRANRTVNLTPAAVAWLKAANSPETLQPINSRARNNLMRDSGLTYTTDVLRHTCISNRQQIEQNDGAVARECGTSEGVIYRHYHRLVSLAEARRWAALRPKKCAGTAEKTSEDQSTAHVPQSRSSL